MMTFSSTEIEGFFNFFKNIFGAPSNRLIIATDILLVIQVRN